jgi:hypothetical protein
LIGQLRRQFSVGKFVSDISSIKTVRQLARQCPARPEHARPRLQAKHPQPLVMPCASFFMEGFACL